VSAYVDNTGTPNTGNYRLGVGYQHANVFNRDQVLNLQAITSPNHVSDVKIFGAGYRIPIYTWGGVVDVLAGYSNVNSGTVQGLLNGSGSGNVFGLRYTQLLGRWENYEHRASIGLDYRAYKNDVTFADTGSPLVPNITVHPGTLAYLGRFSRSGRTSRSTSRTLTTYPAGATASRRTSTRSARARRRATPSSAKAWRSRSCCRPTSSSARSRTRSRPATSSSRASSSAWAAWTACAVTTSARSRTTWAGVPRSRPTARISAPGSA